MSKILIVESSNLKKVHSTLATVFNYKHEEYGIVLVPDKQNIIKLLEKTDAKVIICPELSKFNVAVQGKFDYFRTVYNEKDAALIRKYIEDKNITVIPMIYNSFNSSIEKAFSLAFTDTFKYVICKYSLRCERINANSLHFIRTYKNSDSYVITDTKEEADLKILDLIRNKIESLKDSNIKLQKSIESNNNKIKELTKRLGKSL